MLKQRSFYARYDAKRRRQVVRRLRRDVPELRGVGEPSLRARAAAVTAAALPVVLVLTIVLARA